MSPATTPRAWSRSKAGSPVSFITNGRRATIAAMPQRPNIPVVYTASTWRARQAINASEWACRTPMGSLLGVHRTRILLRSRRFGRRDHDLDAMPGGQQKLGHIGGMTGRASDIGWPDTGNDEDSHGISIPASPPAARCSRRSR